jgi:hypothetical protein
MRRMVRFVVEVLATVGVSCRLWWPVKSISWWSQHQGRKCLCHSVSIVNWMEGLKLLRWLRKSCNLFGPWDPTTNMSSEYRSHSDDLCCAESRATFQNTPWRCC